MDSSDYPRVLSHCFHLTDHVLVAGRVVLQATSRRGTRRARRGAARVTAGAEQRALIRRCRHPGPLSPFPASFDLPGVGLVLMYSARAHASHTFARTVEQRLDHCDAASRRLVSIFERRVIMMFFR
jgi:hypothetical protein